MSASDIRAGAAFIELYAKANLTKGLVAAEKQLSAGASKLAGLGAGLFGGALAAATGLAGLVEIAQDQAGQIDDTAKRLGTSADQVQSLGYAATLAGSNTETMAKSLTKLDKNLADAADGSDATRKKFLDLGLDWNQLAKQTPTERMAALAQAISTLPTHAARTSAAMDLLGKSGAELLPMLANGAAGIEEATRAAHELGLVVSQDAIDNLGVLGDQSDTIKAQLKAGFMEALGAAAPVLAEVGQAISGTLRAIIGWTRANPDLFQTITRVALGTIGFAAAAGGGTLALAAAAKGAALFTGGLRLILGPATAVTRQVLSLSSSLISMALNPSRAIAGLAGMLAGLSSPLGLVAIAATAGAAAWLYYSGTAGEMKNRTVALFGELSTTATTTFTGITAAIQAGDLATAGEVAMGGLHVAWLQGLQALQTDTDGTWNALLQLLGSGDFAAAGKLLWDSLNLTWQQGINSIAQQYDELTVGFTSLFDELYTASRNGLTRVTSWIYDTLGGLMDWVLGLWEKASAWVDDSAANTELAQIREWRSSLAGARQSNQTSADDTVKARNEAMRKREEERGKNLADVNAAYEQQAKALAEQRKQLLAKTTEGRQTLSDQLGEALDKLYDSVDKAVEAKAAAPQLASQGPGPEGGDSPSPSMVVPQSVGTFSAAAAAIMLGGGTDPQQEIASNTAATADNTRQIIRKVERLMNPRFS